MSARAIEALYATGHWLMSNARHREAADVFRVMTLSRPDDERGWLALGACHEAVGQHRIAIELYRISGSVARPAVRSTIARARAHRLLDALPEADEAFELAHRLALEDDDADLAELALRERRAS